MLNTETREKKLMLKAGGGLSYIALWQAAVFFVLILLVWVNELLDLTALLFGGAVVSTNVMRGCVSTAGVIVVGIITVGNTYLQQRRMVQGLLTICSYCKKIRIDDADWQRVEEYIGTRSKIDFTHSVCPECFERVKLEIEKETA